MDITDDKNIAGLLADLTDIYDANKPGNPMRALTGQLRDMIGMIGAPKKPLGKAKGKSDA